MISNLEPLILALKNKKIVTLVYLKETTGETVTHTGGIYEIGPNKAGKESLWLWDTELNDHIRNFLIENIDSFQVLDTDFNPPYPWPLKLNGEIVG